MAGEKTRLTRALNRIRAWKSRTAQLGKGRLLLLLHPWKQISLQIMGLGWWAVLFRWQPQGLVTSPWVLEAYCHPCLIFIFMDFQMLPCMEQLQGFLLGSIHFMAVLLMGFPSRRHEGSRQIMFWRIFCCWLGCLSSSLCFIGEIVLHLSCYSVLDIQCV